MHATPHRSQLLPSVLAPSSSRGSCCAQGISAFWFTTCNCKKSAEHRPPCSTLPRVVPGGTKVSALTGAQRTGRGSQRDRAGFHSKPATLHLIIRASPSSTQTVLGKRCEGTHAFTFAYISQQNWFQAPGAIVAKFSATRAKPHTGAAQREAPGFRGESTDSLGDNTFLLLGAGHTTQLECTPVPGWRGEKEQQVSG